MVGTDPGFIHLSVAFTWTARVKQSVSKCSGHIPKGPVGLKFFSVSRDKSFPLRTGVTASGRSMRLGGILEVVNTRKDLR